MTHRIRKTWQTRSRYPIALGLLVLISGCGTITTRNATDQLLVSDAVDQTISKLDFGPLSGARVFLDTRYVRGVRGVGFVNADYITSALRKRMVMAGCLLQDEMDQAEYVVEVRVGALGTDGHEVNYGIPGNNAISATTSIVGGPSVPQLPELSLARKDERRAAAKVSVFAYRRETREPVWEPKTVQGNSVAKATWVLGAGPFHEGAIYNGSEMDVVSVPHLPNENTIVSRLLPWRKTNGKQPTPAATQHRLVESAVFDTSEVETKIQPVSVELPDPSSA
jgi:hypothetical protein